MSFGEFARHKFSYPGVWVGITMGQIMYQTVSVLFFGETLGPAIVKGLVGNFIVAPILLFLYFYIYYLLFLNKPKETVNSTTVITNTHTVNRNEYAWLRPTRDIPDTTMAHLRREYAKQQLLTNPPLDMSTDDMERFHTILEQEDEPGVWLQIAPNATAEEILAFTRSWRARRYHMSAC